MFHPSAKLRLRSSRIGMGVYATADIPQGTITYVRDALEPVITPQVFADLPECMQREVEHYGYINEQGAYVLSWDIGKYVNHCCFPNTMTTGLGFEIAIRDIARGEEIADEYGLFNLKESMPVRCGRPDCRRQVSPQDLDLFLAKWDSQVQPALMRIKHVCQPLWAILDPETISDLDAFLSNPDEHYPSLSRTRYRPHQ